MAGNKGGKKRTNIEVEASIMQVQDWILDGHSNRQIINSIIDNKWCGSTRQAENIIKMAKDRWVADNAATTEVKRAQKVRELEKVRDGLDKKYHGTPQGIAAVARIQNLIIKLEGLNAPQKVELTGANGGPIQVAVIAKIDYTKLSTAALREIVAARLAPTNE